MPNKVAIVTDSTAYLPEECLKQYNISVIPLKVIWGDQAYLDGVDILPGEFYTRLVESRSSRSASKARHRSVWRSLTPTLKLRRFL